MSAMPIGGAGVAGVGLLNGVHGQGADGVGHRLGVCRWEKSSEWMEVNGEKTRDFNGAKPSGFQRRLHEPRRAQGSK